MENLIENLKDLNIGNRGTGAGGANTNKSGKDSEQTTDIVPLLIKIGFTLTKLNTTKYGFYFSKTFYGKTFTFVTQSGLKAFVKKYNNIILCRCPDEAFIIDHGNGKYDVKVLEKKNQNTEGSVDTKLYAGQGFKMEYEDILGESFSVEYGFCLCDFFRQPKYKKMLKVLDRQEIQVFFASDQDYFNQILRWVGIPIDD